MQDGNLARFAHELESFRSPWEDAEKRRYLIAHVLPRIVATLELLPPATASSRLLELGSSPFVGSQCLDLVWPGQVTHANYFGTTDRRGSQTLLEVNGSGRKTYDYDLFNIETDEFPYPDDSFDVVIFAELIEHLAINPVWALAEMHRVLKPDGHLVVTTPNALSLDRVASVFTGRRPIVDLYSPTFGYGARHNREFSAMELGELLDKTGFQVETMVARDLGDVPPAERLRRRALRVLLRPFSNNSRKAHLFARARPRSVFRWHFPDTLFTDAIYCRIVRHPWVEMGVNDTIQCDAGWQLPEQLPDGTWIRRIIGIESPLEGGSAFLRGVAGASRVAVQLRGEGAGARDFRVRVAVAARDNPYVPIGIVSWSLSQDGWTEVQVPLSRSPADREQLLVNVAAEPGRVVAVRRIALE